MKRMRTLGFAVVTTVLAGVVSMASAQEETYAYSANAVGVIRKTIPAEKMILISIPLDDMASTNAATPFLELPFLSAFPNKSTANKWDADTAKWVTATKALGKWSGALTNLSIRSGEAVFFKNGGKSDITITLIGEVPSDDEIAVVLGTASQMSACANPYPVSFAFTNSVLAKQSKNGATANFWDMKNGAWVFASKALGKWSGATNAVVSPGEGFMYKSAKTETNTSWVVGRPYEWPEN